MHIQKIKNWMASLIIDEKTLLGKSTGFRDLRQLEKDYLLILLLYEIYNLFNDELIFKGGTSLKYFYNLNRFSEDLDFSYIGLNTSEKRGDITRRLNRAFDSLGLQYKVVKREHRGNKENGEVVGINFEISVNGPLNERLKNMQNIKIDISLRKDVLREPDLRYLLPAYQDIPVFVVPVMNIEEIVSEKIAAILERDKMRDIYDLYFLIVMHKTKIDRSLILEKVKRRGENFQGEILQKKIREASNLMKWKSELSYLVNPLPDNMEVIKKLEELLNFD